MTMNKDEYAAACPKFGIDPESFGMEFRLGNNVYRIIAINPKARTLPIEAVNLKTNSIKKFSAEYAKPPEEPVYKYNQSYIGRKFEFCGRIFTIIRLDENVYTSPIVADSGTGIEHRFGAWIFHVDKLDDERIRWVD